MRSRRPQYRLPSSLVLALVLVLVLLPTPSQGGSEGGPAVYGDAGGSVFISSEANRSVIVNGLDLDAVMFERLAAKDAEILALSAAIAEQEAELSSLRDSLRALQVPPFGVYNQLYAIGGTSDGAANLERFNGVQWVEMPMQLSTPRTNFATCLFLGSIYVLGGILAGDVHLGTVDRFDGVAWAPAPSLPLPRSSASAAAYRAILFVTGGLTDVAAPSARVFVFDGKSWDSSKSEMPQPVFRHASVEYNERLFVTGGSSQASPQVEPSNRVLVYDGLVWKEGAPMDNARMSHATTVHKGLLFVAGGRGADPFLQSVEFFDKDTQGWENAVELSVGRRSFCLVSFNNFLFTVGGAVEYNELSVPSADVDRFIEVEKAWKYTPSLNKPRSGHTCLVFTYGLPLT